MRFAWRSAVGAVAATIALLVGLAGSAQAYPGSADDRMLSVPSSWWTYENVDASSVAQTLSQHNARLTDLRVVSASPLRFRFTSVANTGAYASGYWWYYGVTMAQVNDLLTQNHARLISAVRYGSVYAVVMVPNSGANAKTWGWCDTDFAGISTCLGTTNRLTNIVSYAQNRFVVIFVRNDESYGWCWYAGITRGQISTLCSGQSVLDISTNPDGTFNVAKVAYDGDGRVFDFPSINALIDHALTDPQDRALFVIPYVSGSTTRWITSLRHNS